MNRPSSGPPLSEGEMLRPAASGADKGLARIAAWVWVAVLVVLTFWRYLPIGFTDHDSMDIAIRFWHDPYLAWLKSLAEGTGRIFVYTNYFIAPYPYLSTSEVWQKICAITSLVGTAGLFYLALRRITGSGSFAMLSVVLFLAVTSHSINHSLFTGYYFFQLWAMAALGTFILFHRSIVSGGRWSYASALTLWSLSLLLAGEEDRFLYGGFLVLIALHEFGKTSGAVRKTARLLTPFVGAVLVLGIVAVAYRVRHPSQYIGNQLDLHSFSVQDYAKTLWIYTVSSVPGYVFFDPVYQRLFAFFGEHGTDLPGLIRSIEPVWIVRAVAVAVLTAGCLWRVRPVGRRSQVLLATAAVMALVLPQAGLSVSNHYQAKALSGERVMTHFTFFTGSGLALVIACAFCGITFLARRTMRPPLVKGLVCALSIAAGFASVAVDYGNHYVARFHEISGLKWGTVRGLCESGAFASLPEDAVVLAPGLWRVPYSPGYYAMTDFSGGHLVPAKEGEQNYWEKYIEVFAGRRVRVASSLDDGRLPESGFYYLNYLQAPKDPKRFATLGRVTKRTGDVLYADSLVVFSHTPDPSFQIYFNMKAPAPFLVDGETYPAPGGVATISMNQPTADSLDQVRIDGADIDLNSVYPSYLERPETPAPVDVLTNPSFETWTPEGTPEGWNVTGSVARSSEARDGTSTLALSAPEGGQNVVAQQGLHGGSALVGRRIRISVATKSGESGKLGFNFYYTVNGTRTSFSKSHSGSGEWETLTHAVDVPDEADPASLRCLITHRDGAREIALVDRVLTYLSE